MAKFSLAREYIRQWEDGTVDHPADPGGFTRDGISARWYFNVVEPKGCREGAGLVAECVAARLRGLSADEITNLYYVYWWKPTLIYALAGQELANRFFGFTINMGLATATRLLQRAINATGRFRVVVDGKLGVETVGAANALWEPELLKAFRKEVESRYLELIKRNPALEVFRSGWVRRARS